MKYYSLIILIFLIIDHSQEFSFIKKPIGGLSKSALIEIQLEIDLPPRSSSKQNKTISSFNSDVNLIPFSNIIQKKPPSFNSFKEPNSNQYSNDQSKISDEPEEIKTTTTESSINQKLPPPDRINITIVIIVCSCILGIIIGCISFFICYFKLFNKYKEQKLILLRSMSLTTPIVPPLPPSNEQAILQPNATVVPCSSFSSSPNGNLTQHQISVITVNDTNEKVTSLDTNESESNGNHQILNLDLINDDRNCVYINLDSPDCNERDILQNNSTLTDALPSYNSLILKGFENNTSN